MRILSGLMFALAAVPVAHAGDMPSGIRFFGDAYLGTHAVFGNELGEDFLVPMVDLGSRVAVQSGRFGVQLNGDYSGFKLGWIRPDIDAGNIDASFSEFSVSGHATFNFNERFKAGAYLGYSRGGVKVTDSTFTLTAGLDSFAYGLEAIYQHDENNWIEVYGGVIDPRNAYLKVDADIDWSAYGDWDSIGFDPDAFLSSDMTVPLDGLGGLHAGAAYTHRFNEQWSATAKADFTRLSYDGNSANIISLKAIGAYRLQSLPLTLSSSLGYVRISAMGTSEHAYNIGARLTFAFGDSGNDAGGKLFSDRRAFPGFF